MKEYAKEFDDIIIKFDGSCFNNPGDGGAGIAVYGETNNYNQFLFAAALKLGYSTNNYAEYIALILSQLFSLLMELNEVTILGDS
mmetsp:Transcript_22977/g.16285  ORF Transcript_22977/g.16285 Transcript_22977/m.16285 type:complete len:85 (-) Transcript_22977:267-521(-)